MTRKKIIRAVKAKKLPAKQIKQKLSEEDQIRQTGKSDKYAYVIKDRYFGEFFALNSANAWWMDQRKVEDLIRAFKIDCTQEEACTYAGITISQLKYFKELHREFSAVITACRNLPVLKARQKAVDSLDESYSTAMDYLERKRKDEFAKKSITSGEVLTGELPEKDKKRVSKILKSLREID